MSEAPTRVYVLVVDHDVIIRSVICDYLRDCGYHVLETHDARDAVELLRDAHFRVDIVLCDAELAGAMSGFELAREVRRDWPGVRILLSGRQESKAVKAAELCAEGPRIDWPYNPQTVLDRINRLRAV